MTAGETTWSSWPVVTIDAGELEPTTARNLLLDVLRAALAREGEFVVVATFPPNPTTPKPRDALSAIRELRAIRPHLARRCRGLAFVLPAEQQTRHHARLAAADRFWGCPTQTVIAHGEAHRWALSQLAGPGPVR